MLRLACTRLEADPAAIRRPGFGTVRDDCPWARESNGYRGVIALPDHDSGKRLLTLWDNEDA